MFVLNVKKMEGTVYVLRVFLKSFVDFIIAMQRGMSYMILLKREDNLIFTISENSQRTL